jgi:hypothetical protein
MDLKQTLYIRLVYRLEHRSDNHNNSIRTLSPQYGGIGLHSKDNCDQEIIMLNDEEDI